MIQESIQTHLQETMFPCLSTFRETVRACPSFRKHDKETMFSGLFVFRNYGRENMSPKLIVCMPSGKHVCERMFLLLSGVSSSENMYRKQCFRFVHFPETNLGNNVSAKVFSILPRT
jgi:hypothetical protein